MTEPTYQTASESDLGLGTTWMVNSDRSLMGASVALEEALKRTEMDTPVEVAYAWMALADAWAQRALIEGRLAQMERKRHR